MDGGQSVKSTIVKRLYTSGQESDASVYKTEAFLEDPGMLSIKSWNEVIAQSLWWQ